MKHFQYKKLNKEEEYQAWLAKDYNSLLFSIFPYIVKMANKFKKGDEDLIQEGVLAVLSSLSKFNAAKGRLTTFATKIVYHALCSKIRKDKLIKTPSYIERNEQFDSILNLNNNLPTIDIAEKETSISDILDDQEYTQRIKIICEECLDERQQYILNQRLNGGKLKEIGNSLGISKERTRQIYEHSIELIKRKLNLPV